MSYDFNGKVALVTGTVSKRGIGFATARRLAEDGADVAVIDKYAMNPPSAEDDRVENWKGLESVEAEINSFGRQSLAIVADIAKSSEVENAVQQVLDKFGKIDILVNNAGIQWPGRGKTGLEHDEQIWWDILAVNLIGPFLFCRAVARDMVKRKQGGKIINIASRSGKVASMGGVAYGASKAGLINLTQTLALELAPHRINVNSVSPGMTATELGHGRPIRKTAREKGISIEQATALIYADSLKNLPLGRPAQPEDQTRAVAFLAAPESDHITGISINVSGGELMAP